MSGSRPSPGQRSAAGSATVIVTAVGAAVGSEAAAAALACTAAAADRPALLIDLAAGPPPRPSLIATAPARELEERLIAHLPEATVASRGKICRVDLSTDLAGIGAIASALPLVRGSLTVIHLQPEALQSLMADARTRPSAALLRADLPADRALTALAIGDLRRQGIRGYVLKRPPGWFAVHAASLGITPAGCLPARMTEQLLRGFPSDHTHTIGG